MALPQAKTPKSFRKDTGSHNGCSDAYSFRNESVEKRRLRVVNGEFQLTPHPSLKQEAVALFPKFNVARQFGISKAYVSLLRRGLRQWQPAGPQEWKKHA